MVQMLQTWANLQPRPNAAISIVHALMKKREWRSFEPCKPANEEIGIKPTLNAGSSDFSQGRFTNKLIHEINDIILSTYLKKLLVFVFLGLGRSTLTSSTTLAGLLESTITLSTK